MASDLDLTVCLLRVPGKTGLMQIRTTCYINDINVSQSGDDPFHMSNLHSRRNAPEINYRDIPITTFRAAVNAIPFNSDHLK